MIREEEFELAQRRLGELIYTRQSLIEKFPHLGDEIYGNPDLEKAYREFDEAWKKLICEEAKFLNS